MLRIANKITDQLVLGNSQQLPFEDKSFDLVFCRSLLHHLPDPEIAIKEIVRVLKLNGEIVLVDTNESLLSFLPRKIANKGEHFSENHRNLNRKKLEKLLKPYFKIDSVKYFGYVAYPLLGFPDLISVFKYFPFKRILYFILMGIDNVLGFLPIIRRQSWAILIKASIK
jgi:ubiquinone/menaquinone biosynthesis C-methylase UbiE